MCRVSVTLWGCGHYTPNKIEHCIAACHISVPQRTLDCYQLASSVNPSTSHMHADTACPQCLDILQLEWRDDNPTPQATASRGRGYAASSIHSSTWADGHDAATEPDSPQDDIFSQADTVIVTRHTTPLNMSTSPALALPGSENSSQPMTLADNTSPTRPSALAAPIALRTDNIPTLLARADNSPENATSTSSGQEQEELQGSSNSRPFTRVATAPPNTPSTFPSNNELVTPPTTPPPRDPSASPSNNQHATPPDAPPPRGLSAFPSNSQLVTPPVTPPPRDPFAAPHDRVVAHYHNDLQSVTSSTSSRTPSPWTPSPSPSPTPPPSSPMTFLLNIPQLQISLLQNELRAVIREAVSRTQDHISTITFEQLHLEDRYRTLGARYFHSAYFVHAYPLIPESCYSDLVLAFETQMPYQQRYVFKRWDDVESFKKGALGGVLDESLPRDERVRLANLYIEGAVYILNETRRVLDNLESKVNFLKRFVDNSGFWNTEGIEGRERDWCFAQNEAKLQVWLEGLPETERMIRSGRDIPDIMEEALEWGFENMREGRGEALVEGPRTRRWVIQRRGRAYDLNMGRETERVLYSAVGRGGGKKHRERKKQEREKKRKEREKKDREKQEREGKTEVKIDEDAEDMTDAGETADAEEMEGWEEMAEAQERAEAEERARAEDIAEAKRKLEQAVEKMNYLANTEDRGLSSKNGCFTCLPGLRDHRLPTSLSCCCCRELAPGEGRASHFPTSPPSSTGRGRVQLEEGDMEEVAEALGTIFRERGRENPEEDEETEGGEAEVLEAREVGFTLVKGARRLSGTFQRDSESLVLRNKYEGLEEVEP